MPHFSFTSSHNRPPAGVRERQCAGRTLLLAGVAGVLAISLLVGCGRKGPLYPPAPQEASGGVAGEDGKRKGKS